MYAVDKVLSSQMANYFVFISECKKHFVYYCQWPWKGKSPGGAQEYSPGASGLEDRFAPGGYPDPTIRSARAVDSYCCVFLFFA